ncbi:MAG: hypothetical protein GXO71_06045 [Caldiserica bacterium]|nr:hypothetical protein [Caldisericota bacterium]
MRKKYIEPVVKVVKLNPEQAVLQHCSTLAVGLSDSNWSGNCNAESATNNACKKSSSTVAGTDYAAYS